MISIRQQLLLPLITTILCSVSFLQSSNKKVSLLVFQRTPEYDTRDKIHSDQVNLSKINVSVFQENQKQSSAEVLFENNKLFYFVDKGLVTIKVSSKPDEYKMQDEAETTLPLVGKDGIYNREIAIYSAQQGEIFTKDYREVGRKKWYFKIKPGNYRPLPYRGEKIRAYKTTDRNVDWTVLILNTQNVTISKSTFKKNTDGLAEMLFLQLNQIKVDQDNPNHIYNQNTVKVFKSSQIDENKKLPNLEINPGDFEPGQQLRITDTAITLVSKDTAKAEEGAIAVKEKAAQSMPTKKKIRAYKTVNREVDWTVEILDTKNTPISKSIFKKNTDGFGKNLSLQLNKTHLDQNNPNHIYNHNTVRVFKSSQIDENKKLPDLEIKPGGFEPGQQLKITDTTITLVSKDTAKADKQ